MLNTKKILIFMNEKDLKPTGGPVGYLYNLMISLKQQEVKNIVFLQDNRIQKANWKTYLKSKIPSKIKDLLINFNLINSISNDKKASSIDLSQYDIVHFHTTYSLYMNRDNLSTYEGKVILTSHSPKPAHKEIMEDQLSQLERKIYNKKLNKLEKIDLYSFDRADYIVFPCEEAEEPYYNNWSEYKKIKNYKKEKYRYLPTGAIKCESKKTRDEILKQYSIPKDSFIITYVGRHNETKGYDLLKRIGEKILSEKKDVYFLIAGKEEPLKGIESDRWIEVGWTNDPHSIISAADLFVLPNKETYFDLILLEVLSLGKVVLASDTGGNKYFRRFNESGIIYFNSEKEAVSKIKDIINYPKDKIKDLEVKNAILFNQNFTMEIFTQEYIQIVEEICKE